MCDFASNSGCVLDHELGNSDGQFRISNVINTVYREQKQIITRLTQPLNF